MSDQPHTDRARADQQQAQEQVAKQAAAAASAGKAGLVSRLLRWYTEELNKDKLEDQVIKETARSALAKGLSSDASYFDW